MPEAKNKGRILKAAREKQLFFYKRATTSLLAGFSTETLKARGDWHEIFKVMKSKSLPPRLFYPEKLSFRLEG